MLVSVLMSVYNSEDYVERAINSILNQTFTEFEFIIIDDGSNDNTIKIIEEIATKDSRIVLVKNDKNIGLASSLNKGIKIAKGNYIARQDADDISSLDRLENQVKFALENPEVDIIGSDCYIIDINDGIVCINNRPSKVTNYYSNLLNKRSIFPHGSVLIKKDKLLAVGSYDSRFYYSQDGELWLRLISNGAKVHAIDKPLYYYRIAPSNNSKKRQAQIFYNKVKRMIYSEKKDSAIVDTELERIRSYISSQNHKPVPYYMAKYWKSLANAAYFNNNRSTSYKYLLKALKERNSLNNYLKYLLLIMVYTIPSQITKSVLKNQAPIT